MSQPVQRGRVRIAAVGLALTLVALVLSPTNPAVAAAGFSVRGSVNQVEVTAAPSGPSIDLLDAGGRVVDSGIADAQGAYLFRDSTIDFVDRGIRIPAGTYTVRIGGDVSDAVMVLDPDQNPDQSFYDASVISEGYGYLTTRDGTTLSLSVQFPSGAGPGPYPTVIEYSGYSPSNPNASTQSLQSYRYNGYATVAVNMRGTGCSGGAYWYSELLQALDGYDMVETIAAQDWSAKVGMVGISFSGISQLYVAQTQPPNLAAINPMSVIADTYRSTLYPGGILNDGFALDWAIARANDAQPYALRWVRDLIAGGDTVCDANQQVRLQSMDLISQITATRYWEDRGAILAPRTFVDKINVPTLLTGAWQDEQTGGHFASMLDKFSPDNPTRLILTNGTHMEGMSPDYLVSSWEFMDLYVAERKPEISNLVRFFGPDSYVDALGVRGLFPPVRFGDQPDYASALAAYEAEPPVWVMWENGTGGSTPLYPKPSYVSKFASWPPPSQAASSLYLGPDGVLDELSPVLDDDEPRGVTSYVYDPSTKTATNWTGGWDDMWRVDATSGYDWRTPPEGTSATWVTYPVSTDQYFAGGGSVDLWLRSSAADVDLEVVLTEVRPDGQETYIQSGWLRAGQRALDPALSTELVPFQTHLEGDAAPLPAGEFSLARVELFPFAHVLRAGSRLRLSVEAPGGNQPLWEFGRTISYAEPVVNDIASTIGYPSRVVLPLIDPQGAPAALPACGSLRGQPCRTFDPARVSTGVVVTVVGDDLAVSWDPPDTAEAVVGYEITVIPTGESFSVAGDVTELVYPAPPLDEEFAFEVVTVFADGPAPAGSASLLAGIPTPEPTTTTTTIAGTTTTAAPTTTTTLSPTTATTPPTNSQVAAAATSGAPGSSTAAPLPVTGAATLGYLLVAAVVIGLGTFLVMTGRAGRRRRVRR